jgi:hypothetical protein
MGAFSTFAAIYVAFAFIFQASALLFAGIDGKCKSNRLGWLVLIFFTGPIGLLIYIIWGRQKNQG